VLPSWAGTCIPIFWRGFWCYWARYGGHSQCCFLTLLTSMVGVVRYGGDVSWSWSRWIYQSVQYTLLHSYGIIYMPEDFKPRLSFTGCSISEVTPAGRQRVMILFFDSILLMQLKCSAARLGRWLLYVHPSVVWSSVVDTEYTGFFCYVCC